MIGSLYFFIWECLQASLAKLEYFSSLANILDVARISLINLILFSSIYPDLKDQLPSQILPLAYLLVWVKQFGYLMVFKPTRYLIKMILEIIKDI
jgi:hypothetical protein